MDKTNICTFKNYNRSRIRDLPDCEFLLPPAILNAGNDVNSAYSIILQALGFSESKKEIIVNTPVECIKMYDHLLHHVVEKRLDARERYSNFIIPTLLEPYEIYSVKYEKEFRTRYIGLYKGDIMIMVITNTNEHGELIFWNMMHSDKKKMDKNRIGSLIWTKKIVPSIMESTKS
jgi:hypothetical protein